MFVLQSTNFSAPRLRHDQQHTQSHTSQNSFLSSSVGQTPGI